MSLLTLDGIEVRYQGVPAVSNVSLSLAAGKIIAVIGPNGAGKTSLLNAAMGILPYRGRVLLDGEDFARDGVEARVSRGLVLVPERRELFAGMSVDDNLLLGGWRYRGEGMVALRRARDAQYAAFPRLAERARALAGTLSGGERQMLAMARALMARPRALLLDEPSLGLAPLIVREIFSTIAALGNDGVGIVLVEQNALAALAVADQGIVLETGRVVLSGSSAALAVDPRVIASYLGSADAASSVNDRLKPG